MRAQIIYLIIAVATWYYPNPDVATSNGGVLQSAAQYVATGATTLMIPAASAAPLVLHAQG